MIYKEGEDLVALNFENSVTCNLFHGGVVCAKFAHTTFEVFPRLIKSPYKIQKGNLVVRNATGSQMTKIAPADRVQTLSDIFKLSPDIIEKALNILEKKR